MLDFPHGRRYNRVIATCDSIPLQYMGPYLLFIGTGRQRPEESQCAPSWIYSPMLQSQIRRFVLPTANRQHNALCPLAAPVMGSCRPRSRMCALCIYRCACRSRRELISDGNKRTGELTRLGCIACSRGKRNAEIKEFFGAQHCGCSGAVTLRCACVGRRLHADDGN